MTAIKTYGTNPEEPAKEVVGDFKAWGDITQWKHICKSWSQKEDWMKNTKAMEIEGVGCVLLVSTQNEEMIAETTTFIPGVKIEDIVENQIVVGRRLVKI